MFRGFHMYVLRIVERCRALVDWCLGKLGSLARTCYYKAITAVLASVGFSTNNRY